MICDSDQFIDMMTVFATEGCLIYIDEHGHQTGCEDVVNRLAKVRAHFEEET